jgi:hypothetical protein
VSLVSTTGLYLKLGSTEVDLLIEYARIGLVPRFHESMLGSYSQHYNESGTNDHIEKPNIWVPRGLSGI